MWIVEPNKNKGIEMQNRRVSSVEQHEENKTG